MCMPHVWEHLEENFSVARFVYASCQQHLQVVVARENGWLSVIGFCPYSVFMNFLPNCSRTAKGFLEERRRTKWSIVEIKKFRFYRHVSHNIWISLPYKTVFDSSKLKSWLYGAIFLQVTSIFNLMSLEIFMLESVTASLWVDIIVCYKISLAFEHVASNIDYFEPV